MKDEVQVLVDRLAALVEQSVAIDDSDGNIIAISRHYGDEDGYRVKLVMERETPSEYRAFFAPYLNGLVDGTRESPVSVPEESRLMIVGRIGYAIRDQDQDQIIAVLWFIDRGTDLPHSTIEDYCLHFGSLLGQRRDREETFSLNGANDSLHRLLAGQQDALDDTALWLTDARTEFLVLACDTGVEEEYRLGASVLIQPGTQREDSAGTREAGGTNGTTAAAVRRVMRGLPQLINDGRLSLACSTWLNGIEVAVYGGTFDGPEHAERSAHRLVEVAEQQLGAIAGSSGASLAGPGEIASIRRFYVEAAIAAFLTRSLHGGGRACMSSTITGLIASLCTPLDAREATRIEALKALLLDPDGFAFDTVGAVFRSNGAQSEVLTLLRVHRTTLHYRLTQIEERTGLNLHTPADMFVASLVWLRVAARRSAIGPLLREYATRG